MRQLWVPSAHIFAYLLLKFSEAKMVVAATKIFKYVTLVQRILSKI